jgi:NDP-sugar pyrophosphorylase family protein
LVPVGGRPLVDWVLAEFARAGVSDLVAIVNERATDVRDHVERNSPLPVRWLIETTPSSMHSFLRVLETLASDGDQGPFLISTVDTIAPAGTFGDFASQARRAPFDLVLALTTFIDDERPLRVRIAEPSGPSTPLRAGPAAVTGIGDGPFATAGYYLVNPSILREADLARRRGFGALRVFLTHLFDNGYRLGGVPMADSVDVDRPADIAAAELLLAGLTPATRGCEK